MTLAPHCPVLEHMGLDMMFDITYGTRTLAFSSSLIETRHNIRPTLRSSFILTDLHLHCKQMRLDRDTKGCQSQC